MSFLDPNNECLVDDLSEQLNAAKEHGRALVKFCLGDHVETKVLDEAMAFFDPEGESE